MNKQNQPSSANPSSNKKKALFFPKGRNLSAKDCDLVQGIIGEKPYKRDMLIEYLHAIQDKEGHLSEGNMQALANILRIPMAEVYEVATFYAHFDVVKGGASPSFTTSKCA